MVLLLFNPLVGFWQEYKAANALEATKEAIGYQGTGAPGTASGRRFLLSSLYREILYVFDLAISFPRMSNFSMGTISALINLP